jgi:pyrroline-5-carboxylate reductase
MALLPDATKLLTMSTIALIGGGNLGTAIARGLLASGYIPESSLRITTRANAHLNAAYMAEADIILLCVKPYQIATVLEEACPIFREDQLVISAAAGISLAQLRRLTGEAVLLCRAMPNIAAATGQSISCLSVENDAAQAKRAADAAAALFNQVGKSVFIAESLMDAATVLGASGIAFAIRFARACMQGGIQMGFTAEQASTIAQQMIGGAMQLLQDSGLHPEELIDQVTTPAGCTIKGLSEMERNGFSSALVQGLLASKAHFKQP